MRSMYVCIDDRPTDDRPPISKNSNGHISTTDHSIHFMFGSRVGFLGTADRVSLFLPTTCIRSIYFAFGDNITSHYCWCIRHWS